MEKELLSNVLQISGQLKVLHWQTTSYAEHNAFERIYDSLGDLFDKLIEVYSGKYERPKFGGVQDLSFADYDSIKVDAFISAAEEFFVDAFMAEQDSELANIKDEIIAELQQLKYLLSLK
jgi:methenyltetrahydromethanopterin cyclohydrolase